MLPLAITQGIMDDFCFLQFAYLHFSKNVAILNKSVSFCNES